MDSPAQKIFLLSANSADLYTLLNVADEQLFLQEFISPAVVQQCIQEGDTNIARVQLLCEKVVEELSEGTSKMYDSLCEHLLKRSEAYKSMYQRFTGNSQSEVACSREFEIKPDKQTDVTPMMDMKKMDYLVQKVTEIKERLDVAIHNNSSSSGVAATKAVPRPPPFPNPHSDELKAKVGNPKITGNKCGTLLCNENGDYFVNWGTNEELGKFGRYGKATWGPTFWFECSLVLPRQFNGRGFNDRLLRVGLGQSGNALIIKMVHTADTQPRNDVALKIKCHFHIIIKHNDGTSVTELREIISCELGMYEWTVVFQSDPLPFPSFSNHVSPRLRLTLLPL